MAVAVGRPTKYTEQRVERILQAIRDGNYMETAARLAGIAPSTLYEWRNEFPDFSEAVETARAEAEERNIATIQAAAPQQWQAAAWWLERSFPDRYGRREQHNVTGELEVKNPDVAAAIDRFTSTVLRLAARNGEGDAAVGAVGRGDSPSGLPVGGLGSPTKPTST